MSALRKKFRFVGSPVAKRYEGYDSDLWKAEQYEKQHDIAPQRPELLWKFWHEFKEELLKKVRRVE